MIANTLVDWRYLYGKDEEVISVTVLTGLVAVPHKTVRELRTNLGVTFENRLPIP